jgi:hypothetical protein
LEYHSIKDAYENKGSIALLAWRSRNLLELSMWSAYCARSRAHARRVYEDGLRDLHDILDAYQRWSVATGKSAIHDQFASAKQDLAQRAKILDASLEGSYKKVSHAAKECGFKDDFEINYKLCSKFAHQSALRRFVALEAEDLKDYFFATACISFAHAFNSIEGQVLHPQIWVRTP